MASSFIVSIGFFVWGKQGHVVPDHISLILTVLISTVCWVSVTYLTTPTDEATLVSFFQRVRPAGPGWKHIQAIAGVGPSPDSMTVALGGWVLGCVFVYSALFGTGSMLYGNHSIGFVWIGVFVASGLGLWRILHLTQTKTVK